MDLFVLKKCTPYCKVLAGEKLDTGTKGLHVPSSQLSYKSKPALKFVKKKNTYL